MFASSLGSHLRRGCLVAATLLVVAAAGRAQGVRASVSGTVYDASGAVVPNATLTITGSERNSSDTRQVNEAGRYLFSDLAPGTYTLEAAAPGFKKHRTTDLVLEVGQRMELSPTLQLGGTNETVTVTANAVELETASGTVSGVVESKQVSDLPLNARDFYALLQLIPNARAGVPGVSDPSVPSINGGRTWGVEAGVDGAPATQTAGAPIAGAQGPSYNTGLDNVKEFRVLTNTLPAEYGNTYGGYISIVTKSGTNQLHGSAFEYLRNSRLDSNNFFSNAAALRLGAFRRHQFGASFGGPVIKNKTFYFVYYDGLRSVSAVSNVRSIPTMTQRLGNFSDTYNSAGQLIVIYDSLTTRANPAGAGNIRTAFPGNLLPKERLDTVAQKLLTFLPVPTGDGVRFTHANNLVTADGATNTSNKFDTRLDHRFNDSHSIFGRVSYTKSRSHPAHPLGDLDNAVGREQPAWNGVVDYTFVKSNATVIDVRFSYSRVTPINAPEAGVVEDYSTLGFSQTFAKAIAPGFNNMPVVNLPGLSTWGPDNSGSAVGENQQLTASVSRVAGKHTLKWGADLRTAERNDVLRKAPNFSFPTTLTQGPNPALATPNGGYSFASYMLGAGNGNAQSDMRLDISAPTVSGYFQDDWKVSRKLTLNLGIRYDLFFPRTEAHNQLSYFDPAVRNPLSDTSGLSVLGAIRFVAQDGVGRSQFAFDPNNFSPRVGFAYSVTPKTVLRGGFAIMYPPQSYGLAGLNVAGYAGFGSTTSWTASTDNLVNTSPLRGAFEKGFDPPLGSSQGMLTLAGQSVGAAIPSDGVASTYTEQWNFNVQRNITKSTLIEASYLGNRGLHMPIANLQLNQLTLQQMALGNQLADSVANPFYGSIPSGSLAGKTTTRAQLLRPFPHYTGVNAWTRGMSSSVYHALGMRFQTRFKGTLWSVAYTNSKNIDDVSEHWGTSYAIQNNRDLRAERSISTQDVSQNLNASWIVPVPLGRGRSLLGNAHGPVQFILGGWQINGIATMRKGIPLGVACFQNTTSSQGGGCRPNSTGKSAELSGPVSQRLFPYFDVTQFKQPANYTFGNVARSLPDVRGPGQRNFDLSLFKNFQVTERLKLQYRAEAFNLTNTPLFGLPGTSFGDPNFGRITTQVNTPRQVQMALRLDF